MTVGTSAGGSAPHGFAPRSGARALYATFLDLARARGCTRVRAITPPRNQDSVRFHRALGFDVSEPQADYHGPGQDRIVFTRRI